MKSGKKSVLVFGCGELQQSIIKRAHMRDLFVVGVDPCEDAFCKEDVDAFEVVGGQDYVGTCATVEKYGIDAIITAATDKPLVMMARIAEQYNFPFYSIETAQWSTDKFQMKKRFLKGEIPCAKGRLVKKIEDTADMAYPVIVKPRDNSGSRGVKFCRTKEELMWSIAEALENSKMDSVLVEEFIEGQEYSIEGLHYDGKAEVIQFTEKKTTAFPYNVELGHKQPANLNDGQKEAIREIIAKIGKALRFENCPSHTELKINERGIFVIETSPRLGGDYITSTLVPLSTGINMEDQLLHIALGEKVDITTGKFDAASGIEFFNFSRGVVENIDFKRIGEITQDPSIKNIDFKLAEGDRVACITSSLNRYGGVIFNAKDRLSLDKKMCEVIDSLNKCIVVH